MAWGKWARRGYGDPWAWCDDVNRGRWARNRFGALCRGRNVMWLEEELLYGPLDIPVQSSGLRSELKGLIWNSRAKSQDGYTVSKADISSSSQTCHLWLLTSAAASQTRLSCLPSMPCHLTYFLNSESLCILLIYPGSPPFYTSLV